MRYFVKSNKIDFLNNVDLIKNGNMIKYLKEENDIISFYSMKKIEIDGFENVNIITNLIKRIILPNIIFVFGILIMLSIIYTTPYYIREIKYKENSIKDEVVYNYVNNALSDSLINRKLNININDLSKEMSIIFSHYAFIELKKRGSVIYINIQKNDVIEKQFDKTNIKGDFISGYDAYIEHIVVEKGFVVINTNQTVRKEDVLISGNLLYSQNKIDNKYYIKPKGYIIGRVIEQQSFEINKKNIIDSYNGNYITYKRYEIFGKQINNLNKFKNKTLKEKTKFNIGNLFKVIEVTEYEKSKVEFIYTKESVVEYVKSLIYYELEKNRISDKEVINSIKLLRIIETNDSYLLDFIVDKSINIVVFKEYY